MIEDQRDPVDASHGKGCHGCEIVGSYGDQDPAEDIEEKVCGKFFQILFLEVFGFHKEVSPFRKINKKEHLRIKNHNPQTLFSLIVYTEKRKKVKPVL